MHSCTAYYNWLTLVFMNLMFQFKNHLGDNAWMIHFKLASPLIWQPGQFVRIQIPHSHTDALGDNRRFTIASIPADNELAIATRLSNSSFKLALAGLQPGQSVLLLDRPSGDFTWQPRTHPRIFVATGIGITPFYALLKARRAEGLLAHASLFYTTRPDHRIIFGSDLARWAQEDPTFNITFLTQPVEPAQLVRWAPDLRHSLVYVSGPKPMLSLCMPPINLPIPNLKQDNFAGYAADNY
jgi:ferredoxin-NADP reductase